MISELNRKKIGENLRNIRVKKGVTMTEVADSVGISQSSLAMYEAGERIPRDDVKIRLANYYKKTVGSIFFN